MEIRNRTDHQGTYMIRYNQEFLINPAVFDANANLILSGPTLIQPLSNLENALDFFGIIFRPNNS